MNSNEKPDLSQTEVVAPAAPQDFIQLLGAEERAALEKKLVRKLDMRLMPVLLAMIIMKCVTDCLTL